MLSNRYI